MVLRYPMRVKRGDETVLAFYTGSAWVTVGKEWFRYDRSMQDLAREIPSIMQAFIIAHDADIEADEGFKKEVEWVAKLLK